MTKEYIYTVEELAKTFAEDHEKIMQRNLDLLQKHKELYSNKPLPEWLNRNFSLQKAMQTICEEICRLRAEIDYMQPAAEEK